MFMRFISTLSYHRKLHPKPKIPLWQDFLRAFCLSGILQISECFSENIGSGSKLALVANGATQNWLITVVFV